MATSLIPSYEHVFGAWGAARAFIDTRVLTPLRWAAREGHTQIVKLLIHSDKVALEPKIVSNTHHSQTQHPLAIWKLSNFYYKLVKSIQTPWMITTTHHYTGWPRATTRMWFPFCYSWIGRRGEETQLRPDHILTGREVEE